MGVMSCLVRDLHSVSAIASIHRLDCSLFSRQYGNVDKTEMYLCPMVTAFVADVAFVQGTSSQTKQFRWREIRTEIAPEQYRQIG